MQRYPWGNFMAGLQGIRQEEGELIMNLAPDDWFGYNDVWLWGQHWNVASNIKPGVL